VACGRDQGVAQNGAVGASGELDALKAVLDAPDSAESFAHGAAAGAAGRDQRPIDIEEVEAAVAESHQLSVLSPGIWDRAVTNNRLLLTDS